MATTPSDAARRGLDTQELGHLRQARRQPRRLDLEPAQPLVTEVADGIDVTRAWFDRDQRRLHLTLTRNSSTGDGEVVLTHAVDGDLRIDGQEIVARRDGHLMRLQCPDGGPHEVVLTLERWGAGT